MENGGRLLECEFDRAPERTSTRGAIGAAAHSIYFVPMNVFDLLGLHDRVLTPESSKLHLATWNGSENPLDVFFAGEFERWQSWQSKKNFERPHVVSLIRLPGRDRWLLAGCYRSLDRTWVESPEPAHWVYETEEVEGARPIAGRLVVRFRRSGRAAYLDADRWASDLVVEELLPVPLSIEEFPGYHSFVLPKAKLDLIVDQEVETWKGALRAVAGVYVITDTADGKQYVGSATGEAGLWSRWCHYSATGHGGNRELQAVLLEKGTDHAKAWQWSILEIADTHASVEGVLRREAHWKQVLCSREHGYNAN